MIKTSQNKKEIIIILIILLLLASIVCFIIATDPLNKKEKYEARKIYLKQTNYSDLGWFDKVEKYQLYGK